MPYVFCSNRGSASRLTCLNWILQVYKLFVYYTGYKTGDMRKQFAHWAFGVVEFDPNQPHQTILPNTWKFRGHEPWITLRNNGKHGEWHLRKQYKPDKASQRFIADVKDWAFTLRPGSFLSIAVRFTKHSLVLT